MPYDNPTKKWWNPASQPRISRRKSSIDVLSPRLKHSTARRITLQRAVSLLWQATYAKCDVAIVGSKSTRADGGDEGM
jgi:hypothetical protein